MMYDEVVWGDTLCDDCRHKPADCIMLSEPLCLDCADRRLERWVAISINPEMAATLPPLLDRWKGDRYI